MYLVVLCTTMSAPSSSGRWNTGVMKVLSTASSVPLARQSFAIASMSESLSIGLVGVSSQQSLVFGVSARPMLAGSVGST